MLILTVRPGNQIHIGDDIVVAVQSVNGNQVKVGIEAPKEVAVLREELLPKKRAKQEEAFLREEYK